jgi:hypothetical protein
LFAREEALDAQRLDLQALMPLGEPLLVTGAVAQNPSNFSSVALSASASGFFAYRTPTENARELAWFQRQGAHTGTLSIVSGLGGGVPQADLKVRLYER